ncbi:MAG: twitching motility protein PilT [Candidatus Thermoplasmatota archaeon]|nr:twitching motility protein PilT [Candidatus Thermoplasmatota archaeon]
MPDPPLRTERFFRREDLPDNCLILDANALLSPFEFGFNLDLEIEKAAPGRKILVPSSVIRELQDLAKKGDWRVKAALELAGKYPCVDIKGKGDAPIFNLARETGWMVMTQDRKLRASLRKSGVPVLLIRGRGHLQVMEP